MNTARTSSTRWGAASLVASVLFVIAGCRTGLDPRRFEQLAYGDTREAVGATLREPPAARWRLLPRTSDDEPAGEWIVDHVRGDHPHPDYVVACRDGVLAAVLAAPLAPPTLTSPGPGPTPDELDELPRQLVFGRHALAWSELATIDAAHCSDDMHPTTYGLLVAALMPPVWLVLPLVPFVLLAEPLFEGDLVERQARFLGRVAAVPCDSTRQHVRRVLGDPYEVAPHVRDAGCEVWTYRLPAGGAFGCRMMFAGERLRWVYVAPMRGAFEVGAR